MRGGKHVVRRKPLPVGGADTFDRGVIERLDLQLLLKSLVIDSLAIGQGLAERQQFGA